MPSFRWSRFFASSIRVQMRLQLRLVEERGAVDALHRLVARVPLPVRVRGGQQLERLEPSRRGHVRADAEIDEGVAVLDRVAGDLGLTFGLLLDQLDLERLPLLPEEPLRLLARPHLPLVRQILRREFLHLLLDRLEIFRHERALDDEVVEEPFVGRRPDAALRAREQLRDRGGQQVRRAVTIQPQRLGTVGRDDADGRVRVERGRQIDEPIVHDRRHRRLREPRRDLCRHVAGGGPGGHTATRAVWQRDGNL